jgi:nitroimidazol reductase NimA-like FMN-containing flavoprotein (pyridoxamine 5'-phosphate oxidase superfamily)
MKTVKLGERVIEDRRKMEEILRSSKVGRLCFCLDGKPFIIPLNFAYDNGTIYVHGSDQGLKTEALRQHPSVCFEVDEFLGTVPASMPCEFDAAYQSVVAYGAVQVLETVDEKMVALRLIVTKYAGEEVAGTLSRSMVGEYRSERDRATTVVKIQVERMTGKCSIKGTEQV